MLKKWGHTGKSLFYKSVLLLWAALEPIGYRIIFQKIQYSTRSTFYAVRSLALYVIISIPLSVSLSQS